MSVVGRCKAYIYRNLCTEKRILMHRMYELCFLSALIIWHVFFFFFLIIESCVRRRDSTSFIIIYVVAHFWDNGIAHRFRSRQHSGLPQQIAWKIRMLMLCAPMFVTLIFGCVHTIRWFPLIIYFASLNEIPTHLKVPVNVTYRNIS